MDVSKMSDREKSVLLAKALGWEIQSWPNEERILIRVPPNRQPVENIYNPTNMALAWRVLNWASSRNDDIDDYSFPYVFYQGVEELFDWEDETETPMWGMPPVEAIRRILDTILKLVIEAGIIEEE